MKKRGSKSHKRNKKSNIFHVQGDNFLDEDHREMIYTQRYDFF